MRGRFTLNGISEYIEEIARAGLNVDEKVAEVISDIGVQFRDEMKAIVPVDTGNLRNHITVEGPKRDGNFNYIEIGVLDADKDTAIYSNVIEYGSTRQAAQPYFRPVMKGKKAVMKAALQKILERYGLSV